MKFSTFVTLALSVALAGSARAQAPASYQVIGEVTTIDASSRQIILKTDKGESVSATIADTTVLRKVPPGAPDLTKAVRITFADLGKGDRIVAIGQRPGEQGKMEARSVIVMTRSDLTQKNQREQEEWQKRGLAGTVTAVDAKTFSIKSGQKTVVVQPVEKAEYRRYAPDSVRFSDAQASSLAEIKVGDQARVLGDKSEDGTSIKAERIVSGSFRQVAATINSVNAEAGELVIKDLATKKTLSVRVNAESTMRKLPPQMAATLARRYQPGAAAGGGGPDVGQALDRLPALTLAELKSGDAIMLSSIVGSDPGKVTAVMLLAGVEPLLTASPSSTRDIMGGWNVGGAAPSQ